MHSGGEARGGDVCVAVQQWHGGRGGGHARGGPHTPGGKGRGLPGDGGGGEDRRRIVTDDDFVIAVVIVLIFLNFPIS